MIVNSLKLERDEWGTAAPEGNGGSVAGEGFWLVIANENYPKNEEKTLFNRMKIWYHLLMGCDGFGPLISNRKSL